MKNDELSDEQIAAQFRYTCDLNKVIDDEEVKSYNLYETYEPNFDRIADLKCGYIRPIAAQILTVYADIKFTIPLHIELDSGASINYCEESIVLKLGFEIKYNKQVSKLGDGVTTIESIGEINRTFYRNNWEVVYRAVVCQSL